MKGADYPPHVVLEMRVMEAADWKRFHETVGYGCYESEFLSEVSQEIGIARRQQRV